MKSCVHVLNCVAEFLLERETFQIKVVKKIKTHIMLNKFFPENFAVSEIMCENMVEPDRPQMTVRPMRIACWIPRATDTHSEYIVLTVLSLEQWLGERYTYIACLIVRQVFG
jgi:hypothetical protein